MYRLLTPTESLDVTKLVRIAYLTPDESQFLTATTRRPSTLANAGKGEVIADMGKGTPVSLVFLDDEIVGKLIVRTLTELISDGGAGVLEFQDVLEQAQEDASIQQSSKPEDND